MKALVIDAFEFCRLNEHRAGESAISDLTRLAEETANKSGSITWSLQGGADKLGYPKLFLTVSGLVQLTCQRCLVPFELDISSSSSLILAKDEGSADEIDALMGDDESIDVIVGTKALNVMELIEDEILLSIPFSPKHEVCPDQSALDALKGAKKASPFETLKNMK